MHKWLWLLGGLLLAGCGTGAPHIRAKEVQPVTSASVTSLATTPANCAPAQGTPVRAVRFDPAFYYGQGLSAAQLSEKLTARWAANGVNTVYFLAYNPTYGARYRTSYPGTAVEGWGQADLLGATLKSAQARGIKVVAWLYDFRNGGALAQHPEWASINSSGQPYSAGDDMYFMSVGSAAAEQWYQGFISDLLTRYPGLSGVDLAEPIVNWWGEDADFSPDMQAAFAQVYPGEEVGGQAWRSLRSAKLSQHLARTIQTIHGFCKEAHVTMTLSVGEDGQLLPAWLLANETGFDLNAVLNAADRPDVFNAELMWQQWKSVFWGSAVFTPDWTRSATEQTRAVVAGRAKVVVHLEMSDFGSGAPTPPEIQTAMQQALAGGADGLDIYNDSQIEQLNSWPQVASVYTNYAGP